ncbi:MAG: cbb3-type cytochrome c oxidase N-terminal domain-containing protein [Myxococcota bacterium]
MSTEIKSPDGYDDILLDHNYDGIQEYDNPMPGWWTAIFALTVIWAGIYIVGINLGVIPDYQDDLKSAQAEIAKVRAQHEQAKPPITITNASLLAMSQEPDRVATGKEAYDRVCAACHGNVGQGLIGPNLADDYWLHGGQPVQILSTIQNGVQDKGMPPWATMLSEEEQVGVVAYIGTFRGTNPPGAKAAQGELYKPDQAPAGDDTAKKGDDSAQEGSNGKAQPEGQPNTAQPTP